MTAKKKVLKLDDSFTEPEEIVLLITSTNKDYRMAYFLNKYLKFDFSRRSNLQYSTKLKEQDTAEYPVFSCEAKEADLSWMLVSNKHSYGNLIKKTGNIDYLLIARGATEEVNVADMLAKIRKIPNVLFVNETNLQAHANIFEVLEKLELLIILEEKRRKDQSQSYKDYN